MNPARIMVVEDERIVAMHLRQQLMKLGYDVPAPVSSGEQALRRVEELKPNLILMDIHIEGRLDGIETAALVPSKYRIPVIYLTAYSEPATLDRARVTRPYGYLVKPFSERELHATIQMALERARADQITRDSEASLRQIQKMEAIGQLAGGVAHDFNNLLGVIIGNLDGLAEADLADPALSGMIDDALGAALRGASLTRHLLAFSRRQALDPRVTNLDRLIIDTTGLLHRTLGETIQIETHLPADLWPVSVDANQLENALLNLAVNARDAMPRGGKLAIQAANIAMDAGDAESSEAIEPGRYVLITVTDEGTGMPKDVLDRAVEPFFTTKPAGAGTGLGLSMVYGFLRQSKGHMAIESELGLGTAIKLYFPACLVEAPDAVVPVEAINLPRALAGEVVVLVEDDSALRTLLRGQLMALGYAVIEAADGPEGLERLASAGPRIDLLLTDVVLPNGMTGTELAQRAQQQQPSLKVLYMSGYTKDAIVHDGVLDPGTHLLTKPFRKLDLARKVRQMLDRRGAS